MIPAESDTPDTPDTPDTSQPVPAVEAFAHAIAAQAHQHAAATPEDAPVQPGKLPFPRPPFDVEKHLRRLSEKHEDIREMTVLVLRADEDAKKAAKAKQSAHEALDTARQELDELVELMLDEHQAEQDGPTEQLALHEPGRTPCSWERDHPGEVCAICASGGSHNGHHAEDTPALASGDATPTSVDDADDDREEPDDDELDDEQDDDGEDTEP